MGRKGNIRKLIQFQYTGITYLYNLAFGDKNLNTNTLDDRIVSDNGDSEKVLATVIASIYIFTARYPDVRIHIEGSTKARNRLYQMGVNKYLDLAKKDFNILGMYEEKWEWYQKGKSYNAFIIIRKNRYI